MRSEVQALPASETRPGRSYWSISLRRLLRKKVGVTCLIVIGLMYGWGSLTIVTEFTGLGRVTPYGYNEQNLDVAASASSGGCRACQGPSLAHFFGTDRLGRDIFSRIIHALRTTVIVTLASLVGGSLIMGISLGLLAGYFGRFIDTVILRVGEVSTSFPEIFLLIILVATVKPPITDLVRGLEDILGVEIVRLGIVDYLVISMALSIFAWFGMARLVRGQVLQARENQYVEAAHAIGVSTPRMLFRHLLPNIMGPVIVVVSASLAGFAGLEVFLSWLGIGIQPPTPSLGLMIFENAHISVLRTNPHLLLFPVGTLAVLLFSFNLLGDAVADAFNPRTR